MDRRKRGIEAYKKAAAPSAAPKADSAEPPHKARVRGEAPTLVAARGFIQTTSVAKPYRKVAKFLLLIGKNEAADVLRHFSEEEVERISAELSRIKKVEPAEAQKILAEFGFRRKQAEERKTGGVDVARKMLVAAFGEERGRELLHKSLPAEKRRFFDFLEDFEPRQIHRLLRNEPTGAVSVILAHLKPEAAASILEEFEPAARTEVIRRIGSAGKVGVDIIELVDRALRDKIRKAAVPGEVGEAVDGKAVLAEILKFVDLPVEEDILERLEDADPGLAEDIKARLFTIDLIENLSDRELQKVLTDIAEREIALMLKGRSDRIRMKILSNVSERRRLLISDEYRYLGPVPRRDVDTATKDFLDQLRRLEEEGRIVIRRPDDRFV